MSIQGLIDAAKAGDTVRVPTGGYEVQPGLRPDGEDAPIRLKSGITLDLTNATVKALSVKERDYKLITVHGCTDVTIIGGRIVGERDVHLGPTAWDVGGQGRGIEIAGGRNIKVHATHVSRCFGDGLYVQDANQVEITSVVADGNRRQGMSVIHVDGLKVSGCVFSNNGGTPPGDGIDFECDLPAQFIKNVVVERCKFFGNEGSCIGVNGHPGTYRNIRLSPDNSFDMTSQPIWVAGGLDLNTPWWAFLLNRSLGWHESYRWWGYPTQWSVA